MWDEALKPRNIMFESQRENESRERQACPIKVPLIEPLKEIVQKDAGDKADVVIDVIEGVVPDLFSDNAYGELVEALTPIVEQKAKRLVGKLLSYKRKLCRAGNNCKARGCIFLHEREHEEGMGRFDRHGSTSAMNTVSKRRKLDEPSEVIFSNVNDAVSDQNKLREYAARFGNVTGFRKLSSERYLVVFETSESARRLVRSSEPVLGSSEIKKSYNVASAEAVRNELKRLFEEQDMVMGRMFTNFSLGLLSQLKIINLRIKGLVMKEKTKDVGHGRNRGFDQEQSLYCSSF